MGNEMPIGTLKSFNTFQEIQGATLKCRAVLMPRKVLRGF